MKLLAATLVVAAVCGYLLGGRVTDLMLVRLSWGGLAALGLVIQVAPLPRSIEGLAVPLLLVSFVPLAAFAWVNRRIPGVALMLIGIALNFTVIAANHGMPVSRDALVSSGQEGTLDQLVSEGGAKHHLASGEDSLLVLADVISLGPTVQQVVSIGDVAMYAGLFLLIMAGMQYSPRHAVHRSRERRRPVVLAIRADPRSS
jgi:hypothetical protein